MIKKVVEKILYLPRTPFLAVIWMYQHTISPDHGPLSPLFPDGFCRFYPSCSEYGKRAYHKHGVIKGTLLTTYRITRCNPFNRGGIDEVPEKGSVIKDIRTKHLFS